MSEQNPATNAAINRARDLLRPYSEKRYEEELTKSTGKDYKFCQKCRGKKNLTLYHKDDMVHLVYVKKGGKKYKVWYCKACFRTYKPHSRRAGGKNC
jgi:hypothetical protein